MNSQIRDSIINPQPIKYKISQEYITAFIRDRIDKEENNKNGKSISDLFLKRNFLKNIRNGDIFIIIIFKHKN